MNIWVSPNDAIAGADPQWDQAERIHDWRYHVPDEVRAIWHTFSQEQRAAIVKWVDDLASSEEWD